MRFLADENKDGEKTPSVETIKVKTPNGNGSKAATPGMKFKFTAKPKRETARREQHESHTARESRNDIAQTFGVRTLFKADSSSFAIAATLYSIGSAVATEAFMECDFEFPFCRAVARFHLLFCPE
jgi:hypothetical protein